MDKAQKPSDKILADALLQLLTNQQIAFEFGFRCAEKGMNMQQALIQFEKAQKG